MYSAGVGAKEAFGGLVLRHGDGERIGCVDQLASLFRGKLCDALKHEEQFVLIARSTEKAVFAVADQAVKALAPAGDGRQPCAIASR